MNAAENVSGAPARLSSPWWIVLGATLALVVGNGPVGLFSFGLFIKPIGEEFGWDRATMSSVVSIATLLSGIMVPIIGAMMDRWGVKRVLAPVIILYGINLACLSLINSLALLFILNAMTGISGAGHGPIGYVKSISSFFDEHRGTALGIAMAGTGIGTAILPQILQFLIDEHGWRTAYLALAALMVGIALPSVLFLLRDPGDKSVAAEPTIAPVAGELPGIEAKQALTSRTFWLLAIVVFLVASVVYGVIVHAVPFLTDAGVPAAQAATVLIAAGMSTLVGRLLSGFLVDRIFAPFVGIFFFMLAILGLYLFGANVNPVIGMIFIGLASGAEIDLIGYLTSRYFGVKRFGLLYGLMFTVFAAGCAFGPFVMGFTYGADQSYDRAFIGFAIALIVACAILLTLGKYAYPIVKKEKSAAEAKPA